MQVSCWLCCAVLLLWRTLLLTNTCANLGDSLCRCVKYSTGNGNLYTYLQPILTNLCASAKIFFRYNRDWFVLHSPYQFLHSSHGHEATQFNSTHSDPSTRTNSYSTTIASYLLNFHPTSPRPTYRPKVVPQSALKYSFHPLYWMCIGVSLQ